MKILVCGHDEFLMQIIEFTITRVLDASVHIALNREKAIDLLQKAQFDLILIEISLHPNFGIDFIRFIRDNLKLNTPIIVISDDLKESTMRHVKRLGIREYIFKPFSPLELLQTIRTYF
jgi:DNA-binding response OmpR family regulator